MYKEANTGEFICSWQNLLWTAKTWRYSICHSWKLKTAGSWNCWNFSKIFWLLWSESLRGMIRTYSQMHRTDRYSQNCSIIWPVWLNVWVFIYKLSGCGFESSWSHLNFRFRACFEQGVLLDIQATIEWIHSETCAWHDKNIQLNAPYI